MLTALYSEDSLLFLLYWFLLVHNLRDKKDTDFFVFKICPPITIQKFLQNLLKLAQKTINKSSILVILPDSVAYKFIIKNTV